MSSRPRYLVFSGVDPDGIATTQQTSSSLMALSGTQTTRDRLRWLFRVSVSAWAVQVVR